MKTNWRRKYMKVNVIKENDKITVQAPKGARAWKWFSNLGGVSK